ncbi:hypothetical protein H9P43_005083 [Blastocladiella emersonii ATCC 22665]|nr:hypothetical protein H9P43_005083 [Blastocladiella emersonii ATCC 22665]
MNSSAVVARRNDGPGSSLVAGGPGAAGTLIRTEAPRTSKLLAPIMRLDGHDGEVFSVKFSSTGEHLASCSFDRKILLWDVYGECKNWGMLEGHSNAVLDLEWSRDNRELYSASADHTIAVWDVETGARVRRGKGHTGLVSSLVRTRRGHELLVSGSDDGSCKVWDPRSKHAVDDLATGLPVTALACSETADLVFTGSVDNLVKAWDMRAKAVVYTLAGHADTLTGAHLSPDGTALLTNAADNTLRVWDVKPFSAVPTRCTGVLEGAPHDFSRSLVRPEWSPNGQFAMCGSTADRSVVVWDVLRQQIRYKLPGHRGGVAAVAWHPTEPIVASGALDKTIFLGELDLVSA